MKITQVQELSAAETTTVSHFDKISPLSKDLHGVNQNFTIEQEVTDEKSPYLPNHRHNRH